MCGRYLSVEDKDLFEVTQSLAAQGFSIATLPVSGAPMLDYGDVYPTNSVPVLLEDGGALTVAMMTWGYPGYPDRRRPGPSPRPLINARAESVYTSAIWRDSIARRRCMIPAGASMNGMPKRRNTYSAYRTAALC